MKVNKIKGNYMLIIKKENPYFVETLFFGAGNRTVTLFKGVPC